MKSLTIYALCNVLNIYSYIAYGTIWERRKIKWYTYLFVFGFAYIADMVVYSYEDFFPALYSISGFMIIYVVLIIITNDPKASILRAAILLIIGVMGELIAVYVVCGSNELSINEALNNEMDYALMLVISKTIQLLAVFLIYKSKNKTEVIYISALSVVVVFVGSILILDIMVSRIFDKNDDSQYQSLLLVMTIIIVINIVTYILYRRQMELYKIELQNKILLSYIENQNIEYQNNMKMQENERILRHDMKNYMILIRTYAEENRTDKIIDFINEKYDTVGYKESAIHTGCAPIDVILANKVYVSRAQDINIVTNIQLLDKVTIKYEDLIIILGNLIDNAMEAVCSCAQKNIYVNIRCDKGMFITEIINPVLKNINIPKSGCLKSSKNDKGHGYGIKSVRDVSNKYDGEMILSCDNNQFKVKVVLFKKG